MKIRGVIVNTVFLDTKGLDDLFIDDLKRACTTLNMFPGTLPEQVPERISGAEILITNKVQITRKHLETSPTIRLICVVATGTDVIDLQATAEMGVTVCNCQAYGTDSVVQHVFSALLALHTNLFSYHNAVQAGHWQTSDQFCLLNYPIIELHGKTLGIVGSGNLGQGVATIARAFGMNVIFARRPGNPPDDRPALAKMLSEIDILTLHCPLTDQTKNLINAKSFERMKPSAFLINAARGGIVDESALLKALQTGQIAGAAIDVLNVEPPRDSNILIDAKLPNLIITPHVAWASTEARQRIIDQTTENIHSFKNNQPLREIHPYEKVTHS